MGKIKQESGITLVALIIIVVVMIILASVSIDIGTDSLDNTRLRGFYTQLEVIQKRVDSIATTNESYVDSSGNKVYLKKQGKELTAERKNKLQKNLNIEGIYNISVDNFRYFTKEELESALDLLEMTHNVFIDFDKRIIVSEKGITIDNKTHYILEDTTYFVEQDTSKNTGEIQALEYSQPVEYTANTYKVTVNTIGDLGRSGYVKYKKATSKYWETSNNTQMVLEFDVEYNVQYIDTNNNSIERLIKIEFEKNSEGDLIQDEKGKNILTVTEITEE